MEYAQMVSEPFGIQLIRHATLIVSASGKKVLVDPMLAQRGANPPIPLTRNRMNNPLVGLPVPLNAFDAIDGVLLTHLHIDHFDKAADRYLPRNIPVFCQPSDRKKLESLGFRRVIAVQAEHTWDALRIVRVKANHGTGFITGIMGKVSGYMLQFEGKHTVYIAGDAVYDKTLEENITRFRPEVIVVNAGSAKMLFGAPITMTCEDVAKVCRHSPGSKVIAVHMEAINHCMVTRKDLRTFLEKAKLASQVIIPDNGEVIPIMGL